MSAQAAVQQGGAERAARRGFRFRRRHAWWIPGLAIAILGNQLSEQHGLGIWPIIVFQMAPHLATFAGPGAIAVFNFGHHPVSPVLLVAVAFVAALPPIWLIAGLGWLSHVVIGWGIGDGMRPSPPRHA
jgi:hypothetical protein